MYTLFAGEATMGWIVFAMGMILGGALGILLMGLLRMSSDVREGCDDGLSMR